MSAQAIRWSCARCKVSVGLIDGTGSALPDAWTRAEDLTFCLTCSRARAVDAAMDSIPESTRSEDRVRLKRKALIEYEIARTPAAPNRVVANACRTSSKTVAAVRDEMGPSAQIIEPAAPHLV